jgi:AAA15 family ATPase/GTPase
MILQKIDYHEFDGQPNHWALKGLSLEQINLLVGKNATGKTRTINAITKLIDLLSDKKTFYPSSAHYSAELVHINDSYNYELHIENGIVFEERFKMNGVVLLQRQEDGKGKIWYSQKNEHLEFQVLQNQLAISSRRGDTIQHPFLNDFSEWVENAEKYDFCMMVDKETGIAIKDMPHESQDVKNINLSMKNDPIWVFIFGVVEFGDVYKNEIVNSMKALDYLISDIGVSVNPYMTEISQDKPVYTLQANESDRNTILYQQDMSQGMFRVLSLIIHIVYHRMKKTASTILIDDIGEGLDFDRSTKLIKLLIDLAEKNDNIQLVMSTNDRFVMNAVPLKYWQLIDRKGGECTVRNYQNSTALFDEFKFTGLNNFDFLETDFIHSEDIEA